MNWFTGLIIALVEFLKIRTITAQYDLTRRIESDVEAMEAERDRLRGLGDPDGQRRADILQNRILRNQGIAVPLPAASAAPASGPNSANG